MYPAVTSAADSNNALSLDIYPLILVVLDSTILAAGSIVVVPNTGITIGRDNSKDVLLKIRDLMVSRKHAVLTHGSYVARLTGKTTGFFITDCGSKHGTFVNNERLSFCGEKSRPRLLCDLDWLSIGGTMFQVHLHGGTCAKCGPTQEILDLQNLPEVSSGVMSKLVPQQVDITFGTQFRLKQIPNFGVSNVHKHFIHGIPSSVISTNTAFRTSQVFRLQAPARYHPDSNKYDSNFKPPLEAIGYSNNSEISSSAADEQEHTAEVSMDFKSDKGGMMLLKMGWVNGMGLGKLENGIKGPICPPTQTNKRGLGYQ